MDFGTEREKELSISFPETHTARRDKPCGLTLNTSLEGKSRDLLENQIEKVGSYYWFEHITSRF